jgi:hypothetical protein
MSRSSGTMHLYRGSPAARSWSPYQQTNRSAESHGTGRPGRLPLLPAIAAIHGWYQSLARQSSIALGAIQAPNTPAYEAEARTMRYRRHKTRSIGTVLHTSVSEMSRYQRLPLEQESKRL